jgi:hypothetical protein
MLDDKPIFHPGALDDLVAVPAGRCRSPQVFIDLAEWTTIFAGASSVVLEVEASLPHMQPDRGHLRYPVLKRGIDINQFELGTATQLGGD